MKTFDELQKSRNIKDCVEYINAGRGTPEEREILKKIIHEDGIVYNYGGQLCVEEKPQEIYKYIKPPTKSI